MTQSVAGIIPDFTVGDRLRKARECTGLDQAAFAAQLGVSRQTVSNNESGRTHPSPLVIKQWSLRTGVPIEWLLWGKVPGQGGDDGGGQAERPQQDSNLQPSDCTFSVIGLAA